MRRALLVFVALLPGCVRELAIPAGAHLACARDVECPAPLRCDDERELCIPLEGPCVDGDSALPDGAPCTDDAGDDGVCNVGACAPSSCGDGVVDPAREACDLGAANDDETPGACRSDCTLPRCGDGVVDPDEGCDDASNPDCDACQQLCPLGRTDCDGVGGCECVAPALDVVVDRVFSMTIDGDDLYLMAGGPWSGVAIVRVALAGGAPQILVEDVDAFGELVLLSDRVAYRDGTDLKVVPKAGGAPVTVHDSLIDVAADGDDLVIVDDDDDCFRIHPDGVKERTAPAIPAVASVAVVAGEVFASTDLGDVGRLGPDGLEVLSENQFEITGVDLASDGRALWWLDERGALNRLVPDGAGVVVAARAPPPLVGARPFELQVDDAGYAWRAQLPTTAFDEVVVVGVPPGGPRVRARPDDPVDSLAIGPTHLCFSSFDLVSCLPR